MNVFSFNQASGNHVRDVEDQNSHCGTDVWVDNAFGNRQPKLRSLSGPPICVHTSRMLRVSPVVVLLFSVAVLNAQHGMVAAAGGGASTIGVVNTATNTSTLSLPITGQFTSFAVTPGGASAYFIKSSPCEVVLIDLATGDIDATISIPSTGISAIALSPDGSQLFMAGTGGATFPLQVLIVDTASNTVTKSTSLPDTDVPLQGYQIAVSTDGGTLRALHYQSCKLVCTQR